MSRRTRRARLFVAVDPPEHAADQLAAWARAAVAQIKRGRQDTQQPVRVLDPQVLHATVLFLGERPLEDVPALSEQLRACARPSVELSVGAPLWLPPRRPRALAVELHDENDALTTLHAEVETRLGPAALPPPAADEPVARARTRRFHPHITVARMRSQAGSRSRGHAVGYEREPLPPTPALSFRPSELVLYRSWLAPEGASYEPLASFALGQTDAA